jgi:hypothetical protein
LSLGEKNLEQLPHGMAGAAVAQKVNGLDTTFTFLRMDNQAVLAESSEKLAEMSMMSKVAHIAHQDVRSIRKGSRHTSSMALSVYRWKVLATLRNPKGRCKYSNRPKGVVTAVLDIPAGLTRI